MSAIIQGKIYDQLYSPAALARPEAERGGTARVLAAELRELINENRVECYVGLYYYYYSDDTVTRLCDFWLINLPFFNFF